MVSDCMQYAVLDIRFWSVKCVTVTVGYAKIPNISIARHQAMCCTDGSRFFVRIYTKKGTLIRSRALGEGQPAIRSRAFGVGHLAIRSRAFRVGEPAIQTRVHGSND